MVDIISGYFLLSSLTVWDIFKLMCVFPNLALAFIHTHTPKLTQSTHLEPSGADKVQLASLARLILLKERHRGRK